ncbi:DUF397 domain-containing protein [Streptomyces sp. JNUCC 64]
MTTEPPSYHWVKASYSDNGGYCVEWAPSYASVTGVVPVRDSKSTDGPVLTVSGAAWSTFVVAL